MNLRSSKALYQSSTKNLKLFLSIVLQLFNRQFDHYCLATSWTKVFSHDTSGGLFTDGPDAFKKNKNNPDAKLFSVLNTLQRFKMDDGKFHLKLCYPELGGRCNEWTQTTNLAKRSDIRKFVAINLAFSNNFTGLGVTLTSASKTFIDATPSEDAWSYAIGAFSFTGSSEQIPGPVNNAGRQKRVTKVELYAEQPGIADFYHFTTLITFHRSSFNDYIYYYYYHLYHYHNHYHYHYHYHYTYPYTMDKSVLPRHIWWTLH